MRAAVANAIAKRMHLSEEEMAALMDKQRAMDDAARAYRDHVVAIAGRILYPDTNT
jgi:hypothetical protein